MIRLLLLLLLMPSLASATGVGRTGAIGEMGGPVVASSSSCGSVGLVDENFDTTGYCDFVEISVAGTNTMDENDTSDPQSSPNDLKIVFSDTSNDAYARAAFTEQTGIIYAQIKIKVLGAFSASYSGPWVFCLDSSASFPLNPAFSIRIQQTNDTTPRLGLFSAAGVAQWKSSLSLNTWYTVKVKYYSDGTTDTEWKVDDATQTAVAEASNIDSAYAFVGGDSGAIPQTNTSGILVDDIIVSTTSTDISW